MKFRDFLKKLLESKFYIFSFQDLLLLFPEEKPEALKKLLYRWRKKGWIYSLKRGLFALVYPRELSIPDLFIANKLYEPSYVSLETALSHYSIIPEVSMAVISVTTKPTREFKNKYGLFLYHTVKPACFVGYYIEKVEEFEVLIAEPEKALVDFLYFRIYRVRNSNLKDFRLDAERISLLNMKKVERYWCIYGLDPEVLYAYLRGID